MTREEALNLYWNVSYQMSNSRQKKAVDMAFDALREQPRWISVEERLPDLELVEAKTNDTELYPCLAVIKNGSAKNGKYVGKVWYDGYGFMNGIGEPEVVTHWMPLPEPPEEVER